jgi:hypothetical protein
MCRSSGDSVECALLGVAGHSDDVEHLLAGQMYLHALCRRYELRFRDGLVLDLAVTGSFMSKQPFKTRI